MIKVSAPGKILWIGSYSVVFGGISHVIAVNKRVSCSLREIKEKDSLIFHTSYGHFKNSGNELINSVLDTFRERLSQLPQGYEIDLYNDKEFIIDGKKTGLGSSSAATVSLTACLYYAIHGKLDLFEIHKLAQIANYKRQKGIGSGFDIASAVFGSIVYKRFTDLDKMDFYFEKLNLGNYDMMLGFTGKSSETVGLVRKFVEKSNLDDFKEIMRLIDEENYMAINLIKLNKLDEAVEHIKLGRKYLNYIAERIVGVKLVSKMEEELIKIAEEEGALVALSPGAGGGDSIFALGNDLNRVREAWSKRGIFIIDVKEDEGLRLESN